MTAIHWLAIGLILVSFSLIISIAVAVWNDLKARHCMKAALKAVICVREVNDVQNECLKEITARYDLSAEHDGRMVLKTNATQCQLDELQEQVLGLAAQLDELRATVVRVVVDIEPSPWSGAISTADVAAVRMTLDVRPKMVESSELVELGETDEQRWGREADEWISVKSRQPLTGESGSRWAMRTPGSWVDFELPLEVFDRLELGVPKFNSVIGRIFRYPNRVAAMSGLRQVLVSLRRDGLPLPSLDD